MSIDLLAKQLKELITEDDIRGVIEALQANLDDLQGQILEADLMQYAARLSNMEREKDLGIIMQERYNIERNQLRQILIEKIVQLQKEEKAEIRNPVIQVEDGDLLLEKAARLFQDGNYREAELVIKQAMDQEFVRYDLAEAYAILGNIYLELDYHQDAIEAFQKALELDANSGKYWTNLGVAYRLTAQYDKAESCYMRALELNPDYAKLYTSLGALHLTHTMKFEEAIRFLEKAIQLDPGQEVAYANMALAQASVGNFASAEQYLVKATMKGYRNTAKVKQMIDNLRSI
ncbi:tetratricopeptide repeat protein [Flavilitoribacter nigricans]|nr:tetratricopeptide repeat protein [Flavilitoribacter nigricans]